MSYDCYLNDPVTGETLTVDFRHQIAGGIRAVDGTNYLWLNITFNYAKHFSRVMPKGLDSIEGKSGAVSIPILERAIAQLKDDVDDDYWNPTEGNAKRALCGLLALAKLRPDGVWHISK